MFRPIKNLITYIQKNASGTSIFGGTTAEKALITEETTEAGVVVTETESDTVAVEAIETNSEEFTVESSDMDVSKLISPVIGSTDSTAIEEAVVATINDFDEDDIETQIKSSVMLRKPINSKVNGTNSNNTSSTLYLKKNMQQHDHNQNHAIGKEEYLDDDEDYDLDSLPPTVDDFCSVGSEDEGPGNETEEFATEEEEEVDEEEPFLELAHELEAFPNTEIIVLSEPELAHSLNSDALSEDPLAIEECIEQQPAIVNPLDSNNDSTSDVIWINVENIRTFEILPKQQSDSCETTPITTPMSSPQKQVTTIVTVSVEETNATPLNKSATEENVDELRSDGSDSGLGSEASALQTTLNSATDTSQYSVATPTPTPPTQTLKPAPRPTILTESINNGCQLVAEGKPSISTMLNYPLSTPNKHLPMRSNLKRRLDADDDPIMDTSSSDTTAICTATALQKKQKRSINFDNVQVFYFPRQQGFGCVPSAGGCTLGMGAHHVSFKTLSLAEHAAELRRAHRQQLQEVNPRGSSSEESEESEEDYLSEGSGSDLDAESSGFLQPVTPKQRRALLKAAGVRKIDASEKVECRDIRNSREVCGCTCRDFCDPETCACSQAGIKCQVDRAMFPCGCSRDACGNTVGRVEFNPSRVRTHFIHTIMRLEMETRHQQKSPSYGGPATSNITSTHSLKPMTSSYYSMQSHSNYSSGYASPAYPSDPTATFYQQQSRHFATNGQDVLSQTTTHTQYPVDNCLDATNLFTGSVAATPSYGELMPSYGSVVSPATTATSYDAPPLNYASIQNGMALSPYSPYNHSSSSSSNYLPSNSNVSTFSSCAVPSVPPYGTATTTAASALYHSSSTAMGTTTAASTAASSNSGICATLDASHSSSNFISLSSPISSSSRLSAINNLLQHNRNTTAALVAVRHTTSTTTSSCSSSNVVSILPDGVANSSSIDTPPIEYAHKSCLAFEEIPPPLNPTPIVGVLQEQTSKSNNDVVAAFNSGILPIKSPLQTEPTPASAVGVVVEQPIVQVMTTTN